VIARDFDAASRGLGSIEELIARARAEDGRPVQRYWSQALAAIRNVGTSRWQAAALMIAVGVIGVGALWWSRLSPIANLSPASGITALHFATGHGEQQTQQLADHSVLHLNTDSAAAVRYSKTERLVVLESGEAAFEVAHESKRAFRVLAGPAQAIAHGTQFDMRLQADLATITVVEGRVGVSRTESSPEAGPRHERSPSPLELNANQQITVSADAWPVEPTPIDARRTVAWLHHQISFDQTPLKQVAGELNRYAKKPIEIAGPKLGNLKISGTFSTDDSEEFIAFLRSLDGVRVEVTAARIVVSEK
jgi:transmembrane sensor